MSLLFMLRLPNKYVPHQMTTVTSFSDVTSWDVSFFSGSSAGTSLVVNPSGWLQGGFIEGAHPRLPQLLLVEI